MSGQESFCFSTLPHHPAGRRQTCRTRLSVDKSIEATTPHGPATWLASCVLGVARRFECSEVARTAYGACAKKSRRRDRYLCVACRPHTRPQRLSPRRRELARAPQTHHTHRKPRHPTLASRSERECAPLQHAAHMTQAMSSFTSTHHVASNAHKAPRNAPGTLSRPSRAHSNAPIPAQ